MIHNEERKLNDNEFIELQERNAIFSGNSEAHCEDRMKWNPDWILPEKAVIDDNGFLQVWYLDA